MDAARTQLKQIALLLAVVLLVVAPAAAQVAVSKTSVDLTPFVRSATFDVITSGAAVNFTVARPSTQSWFSISPTTGTAGLVTVTVSLVGDCLAATCTGTITVANTANAADTQTVTVNYSNSAGSSTITATPSTLNLSTTSNQIPVQGTVTLSTSSVLPISFQVGNISYTGTSGWLTAAASSTSVASGTNATVTVAATPTGLPNGVYNGSFTVTPLNGTGLSTTVQVSLTVGASSSTGSITATPNAFTLNYPGGPLSQNVTVTSSSAITGYYATPTSQNSWLVLLGSYTTRVGLSFGAPLQISVNPAVAVLLPTGTYTGTVALENPLNPADITTINVTLNVNGTGSGLFNPSSLTFNASVGGTLQTLSVTPTGTGQFAATIPSTCTTWLAVGQSGSTFNFTVMPYNLTANGTYTCNVPFTKDNVAFGSLPITLNIGGGSTGSNPVGPTTLNFAYQTGISAFPAQQQITVGGTGAFSISVTQGSSNFISATSSGTAPGTIFVGVINGLPAGNYTGTVNVTTPSGTTPVTVNLQVATNPVIITNPGSMNFNYKTGDPNYTSSLSVQMSDNSNRGLTVSSPDAWITVSNATASTTPASFQVSINPSSLPSGLQSGTISVVATGAANTPLTIPVTVLVNNASTLTVSATQLNFTATAGGTPPATQQLIVSAANTGTAFTAAITGTSCTWLTLSESGSLVTPKTFVVSANQASLAASTTPYTCSISLTSGGITQTVPVNFTVSAPAGGSGNITVDPTSLTFTAIAGGTNPPAKGLSVRSASGTAPVAFTVNAVTSSGGAWLNPGTSNGNTLTTPTDFAVSVNITNLTAGTYTGSITYTPNGGQTIVTTVTLNVTSPAITIPTTPIAFTYKTGDPNPTAQTLQVTGGTGLTFSATASSTGNWLSVTPATGTAGGNISISANPTNLTPGTYNGTVTVTGTGGATGTNTLQVTLTVSAPLPNIDRVTNGASNQVQGNISAGEIITIVGTNLGPAVLVQYQIDSTGKFATTLSGVQVLVNGIASPLVYVSAGQVAAIVPYEIASPFVSNPTVRVIYQTQGSNTVTVAQAGSSPGLFTANSTGTGPGAILNGNNSYNLPGNGAAKGEVVQLFMTGEGQTTPAGVTGKLTTLSFLPNGFPFTPQPILPISVLIDGQPAQVTFWGEAPGLVAGLLQINAIIPQASRSGNVPVQVLVGGGVTQSGVTVTVR